MAQAKLDQNSRPTLTALSSLGDGSIVPLFADPTTHRLLVDATGGGGSGDVVGPASSTADDIALFDGVTGKLIKDSGIAISSLAPLRPVTSKSALVAVDEVTGNDSANGFSQIKSTWTNVNTLFRGMNFTWSGFHNFLDGTFRLAGATSGTTTIVVPANTSGIITIPAATDTLVGKATTDVLTNKTFDTAGTGNVLKINTYQVTDKTGTGKVVLDTSPQLITPNIGVATGTSLTLNGTAGAGFLVLPAQSSNPTSPAAGNALLHAATNNGFTRVEQDNESATNIVLGRDLATIVKNTSGSTLNKGQIVYITGSTGNVPNVALAKADAIGTLPSIYIAVDSIANNAFGQVMRNGILANFDTSAFSSGASVWVSATTAGGLTETRPSGANYVQRVGTILVSGVGDGSIDVSIATAIQNMETGTNAATFAANAVTATTVTTSGNIELGNASDTTISRVSAGIIAVEGVNVLTTSGIATASNKRIQPRTSSATTTATLTPDLSSANVYYLTAQSGALTIAAPTGTPVIGETIFGYITDNGTPSTLTFNATYKFFGVAAPATTTASKTLMFSAQYNGTNWMALWANQI